MKGNSGTRAESKPMLDKGAYESNFDEKMVIIYQSKLFLCARANTNFSHETFLCDTR